MLCLCLNQKAALPTAPIVVRDDDGNVVSEEVHVEMAEDYGSVLFHSKIEELVQQGLPLPRPTKR